MSDLAPSQPPVEPSGAVAAPEVVAVPSPVVPKPPTQAQNWRHAHVLSATGDNRRLWRFKVTKDSVGLPEEAKLSSAKSLPGGLVGKGWNTLLSPALNVAWLPAADTYLRVVAVPAGPLEEIYGLVELQLDKLSPQPVSHVIWSVEMLPNPDPKEQTALVVIVPRARVEEHLAALEASGFVADRLEVPFVGQLRELPAGDGLWVLTDDVGPSTNFLLAWRVAAVWREVSFTSLPNGPGLAPALTAHLTRMAWAGEFAGWLPAVYDVRLVAPASRRGELETALTNWRGGYVQSQEPVPSEIQATASAKAQLQARAASLLPPETQARQRQQFVDRLWLQGLGALGLAYLAGVVVYLVALNWQKWQLESLQSDNAGLARQYTNTLQTRAQKEVLEEQWALRYAALDSWQGAIEKLPPTLNLSTINFVKGRSLRLDGTVAADAQPEVVNFHNELRKLTLTNGLPLFSNVKQGATTVRGPIATWSLEGELNRSEAP